MSSVRHRLPVGPSKGSSGGGWPSRNLSSMRTQLYPVRAGLLRVSRLFRQGASARRWAGTVVTACPYLIGWSASLLIKDDAATYWLNSG